MRNTKTTNILLIIIIVILLAPGLLLGLVYVSNMMNMGKVYETRQAPPEPTVRLADTEEALQSMAEAITARQLPDYMPVITYDRGSGTCVVELYKDGMTRELAEAAAAGEQEAVRQWETAEDQMVYLQEKMQELADKIIGEHADLTVGVRDYNNANDVILQSEAGAITYNAAETAEN